MKYENLTGLTVKAKKKNPINNIWEDVWIPVTILAEYPKFLLGEVQPHKNPSGQRMSKPYRITIKKHDIDTREVRIK